MSRAPYLQDPDLTIYNGDVREVLRSLPDESVQMCVTSPPYWGLRDYGTGAWEGGNVECDHLAPMPGGTGASGLANYDNGLNDVTTAAKVEQRRTQFKQSCGKCGATRVDNQLGLELTLEAYVEKMVEVFREVRRVLRKDGTLWLNLGDSYAANRTYQVPDQKWKNAGNHALAGVRRCTDPRHGQPCSYDDCEACQNECEPPTGPETTVPLGLKPKDLCMIPARVALALQADGWYLRSEITWCKPNPMPESVTDRPTQATEKVFLFSRAPRYFFDAEAVREPYKPDGRKVTTVQSGSGAIELRGESERERWPNSGRNLRNWWEIATEPYPEAHFATYPQELVRRCILAGSAEGDVVLDPFGGSGTTAYVARKHGRRTILIELSADYCALAGRRTQQLSLGAEAVA